MRYCRRDSHSDFLRPIWPLKRVGILPYSDDSSVAFLRRSSSDDEGGGGEEQVSSSMVLLLLANRVFALLAESLSLSLSLSTSSRCPRFLLKPRLLAGKWASACAPWSNQCVGTTLGTTRRLCRCFPFHLVCRTVRCPLRPASPEAHTAPPLHRGYSRGSDAL